MSEDFDAKAFNESLPKGFVHAIFFTAKDMEDLTLKCNALVGRIYSNKETGEGWFVSGIKQILKSTVHEPFEAGATMQVVNIHALVLPEFEEIEVVDSRKREETEDD